MNVDVIFLSRDLDKPRSDVWESIKTQEGVDLRVIRQTGPPLPEDSNRFETIVRARNAGKQRGTTPFVLLLDDDVVLGPRCVSQLVKELRDRPDFAAIAADSAGDMGKGFGNCDYPWHVGMAAVLFRREQLESVKFRWEPDKCECRCCCEDLRTAGFAIGYSPRAEAWHRPSITCGSLHGNAAAASSVSCLKSSVRDASSPPLPGRILSAFDRKHLRLFQRRFLRTLRAAGNPETVTTVTSGLYSSEQRILASTPGVEVYVAPNDGHPARQRLRDFQHAIAGWPGETPVAYWDAGDVVFQDRIAPLWDIVRSNPEQLLVSRESLKFENGNVSWYWTATIHDPEARQRAMDLFRGRWVLNSGFAAGTVRTMLRYLRAADQLLHSTSLSGSTDWGDQTAMNLYCYMNQNAWREVPSGWNYCHVGLKPHEFRIRPDGFTDRLDGEPLYVVHGAGQTLKRWDLVHLTA